MKINEIFKDLQEKINPEYISKITSLNENQVAESIEWSKGPSFDFVPFKSMLSGVLLQSVLKKEPLNKKGCHKYIFNNAMEIMKVEKYGNNGKLMWIDYVDNANLISITIDNYGDNYGDYLGASKLVMDESGKVNFSTIIDDGNCVLYEYTYTGNHISSIKSKTLNNDTATTIEVVYSNGIPVNLSYIRNGENVYLII